MKVERFFDGESVSLTPWVRPMDAPAANLRRALSNLEKYGWCQGTGSKDDKTCLRRAIEDTATNNAARDEAFRIFQRVIGANNIDGICRWNDDHKQTFPMVHQAFLDAIAIANIDTVLKILTHRAAFGEFAPT